MTNAANQLPSGVITALATPFQVGGGIDWQAFAAMIKAQQAAGVSGLVIAGSTGEAASLHIQERLSLLRKARALCSGKVHLMAGVGLQSTSQSCELAKLAETAGADSLLVVTPPYVRPSLAGLLEHFNAISQEVSVPLCLYHVPARTGQYLSQGELLELCNIPGISMVKEASGDLNFLAQAAAELRHCSVFAGDDASFLASLAMGASGCISVIANLYPQPMNLLYQAFLAGRVQEATKIHRALAPLMSALFVESNPGPLKYCLQLKYGSQNILRLPLAAVTLKHAEFLRDSMECSDRLLGELQL